MNYHFSCILFMKFTHLCSVNGLFKTVIENELLLNFEMSRKTAVEKPQLATKTHSIAKSNIHHTLIKADVSRSREKESKGYEAGL